MKNKILVPIVLMIVFAFVVNVYAVGQGNAGTGNQNQQQTQTSNQGEDNQIQTQNNEQTQNGNGAGQQTQNQNQEQSQEQKKVNAEEHRSTVANFVQSLLQVADREGGIGEQVRTIAQQQNQSAEITVQAMEKVQTRNRIKTFFLGSDYKNLGTLRSEAVQTTNRLEQLNTLMESAQNESDKIELQTQIQTLEQEQAKIESFIKAEDGKFSLFGWFMKLFTE
ncbi:MAG: hypothetical protein WC410_03575 [Candidatus Paceibacterota bacterium]|jgi:hypothetical protein|nr:hypothetical protein [Candidatus Paceibacterota bacterium]MDD5555127.1 hypothetical protein [Candidatus Paceibacterota bacterium]